MPRAIGFGLKLMTVSAFAIAVTTTGTTAGTMTTGSTAVAGVETAPQMGAPSQTSTQAASQSGAGVRYLPSTSIPNDSAPLAILGVSLMAIGGALLRRPRSTPYR
jgi:LPXTG-motif cell wall-anchored protein